MNSNRSDDELTSSECVVYVNVWRWSKCVMVSACDERLLGEVLRDGEIVFEVREDFYKGSKMTLEEAIDHLKDCTIANLVGRNIVKAAIEKRLVHPEAVIKISGVPHAQIVRL